MISKFAGFFDPAIVKEPIHLIGCGAIGSTLAVQLARCGLTNITLWDFDIVQQHNLANQQFMYKHIGFDKTEALADILTDINPQIKLNIQGAYTDEKLSGYIFLGVDSIDVRKLVVNNNMYNNHVKAVFDFRMRLKDAQHYGADWSTIENRKNLLATMDFTSEEAKEATPVNACGLTMSIIPTIETVVAHGVANFINFLHKPDTLKRFIMVNPFDYD